MYIYDFASELPVHFTKHGKRVKPEPLYVAETGRDVSELTRRELPYIKFNGTKEQLTNLIMLPFLLSKYPGIKWLDLLDLKRKRTIYVNTPKREEEPEFEELDMGFDRKDGDEWLSDQSDETRLFNRKINVTYNNEDINDYFGDVENVVDIERLNEMHLVPKFLSTIIDAIAYEADDVYWVNGYNKKVGCCIGNLDNTMQARNLIIIDVSASIPPAVSATMLSLADSMRERMVADLIITGGTSYFWEYGETLPTPQELRKMVPRSNESVMFRSILREHIFHRDWDNVICFGDNDTPYMEEGFLEGISTDTNIGKLYSFRVLSMWERQSSTGQRKKDIPTGYCTWIDKASIQHEYEGDVEWIKDINDTYKGE